MAGSYEMHRQASWNLYVQLTGRLNGVVTVLVDGIPVDGGLTTNLQWKCGPVFTNQNSQLKVTVVGMTPNEPVTCFMQGVMSEDVSDFAAIGSPGYGGGSVQNDPSQLLSAELGDPLIENVTIQIPHGNPNFVIFNAAGNSSVNPNLPFLPFNISGYGAILIHADPNSNSNTLWLQINWYDALGNFITITNVDSLAPACTAVVAAQGKQCDISVFNVDAVNHGVNSFSVIPLVAMPTQPDKLLDNFGLVFGSPTVIDNHSIIAFNTAVGAGVGVNIDGNFVWPGRATLSISGQSTGTGGNTWWAQLHCISANGVDTLLHAWLPGTFPVPIAIDVQLLSGLPRVHFQNTGAGSITPIVSLTATS
jgi:hypothetical protein